MPYPNPFNPATSINYYLPQSAFVNITIFDLNGRELEVLVNKTLPTGSYNISWNGDQFSAGIYIVKMTTPDFIASEKMGLLK